MRSQKIRLKLTNEQTDLVWWYSKVARNYWNLLVDIDKRNNTGEFDSVLESWGNKTYFSKFFNRDVYNLSQLDYTSLVNVYLSSLDNVDAFSWYFTDGQSTLYNFLAREFVAVKRKNKGKVSFRSVNKVTPSFPVRCDAYGKRLSRVYQPTDGCLQIPSLGQVKIGSSRAEFDLNCKKQTARISFDGKYWYLSYTEPVEVSIKPERYSEGIGVDLGIKTLATLSDGTLVPNIRTFRRVRVLSKRLKIAQRKLSYKYRCNKTEDGKFVKTKNIIKLERKIKLIHRTIRNIRVNHIREFVASVVRKNPMYIAIEDLNVKGVF